jgi:hypothetical protein
MGNFIIAQVIAIFSPAFPIQFILLVSVPDVVAPEIEVGFFRIVVKADMAIDSALQVTVFVIFGPVALDVYLSRAKRYLSRQDSFLGQGLRAGYQAENHNQQENSGRHPFTPYRTKVFPLTEGPLLPWILP